MAEFQQHEAQLLEAVDEVTHAAYPDDGHRSLGIVTQTIHRRADLVVRMRQRMLAVFGAQIMMVGRRRVCLFRGGIDVVHQIHVRIVQPELINGLTKKCLKHFFQIVAGSDCEQ